MTDNTQKELADELWKWTIDKVKKDNVVKKNPTEYDKWVEDTLEVSISTDAEGMEDGWFRENEFHHLWVKTIDKLADEKDEKVDVDDDGKFNDISDEEEACAVEFLTRLATYWHNNNWQR
jgi:hypothetical protein